MRSNSILIIWFGVNALCAPSLSRLTIHQDLGQYRILEFDQHAAPAAHSPGKGPVDSLAFCHDEAKLFVVTSPCGDTCMFRLEEVTCPLRFMWTIPDEPVPFAPTPCRRKHGTTVVELHLRRELSDMTSNSEQELNGPPLSSVLLDPWASPVNP